MHSTATAHHLLFFLQDNKFPAPASPIVFSHPSLPFSPLTAGKDEVRKGYKAGALDAFNGRDAPWGHGPTNTTKWVRLSRPILYRVQYEPKYEPFVIMSRQLAPWCDERFVGYGGNKIAYINQLQGLGFGFHVHPYGFAIHVPHVRTRAADIFVARKQRGEAEMEELRLLVESEVKSGKYIPAVRECHADAAGAGKGGGGADDGAAEGEDDSK